MIASRGYVVTSINYRLGGEAPFPAAIQDVKAAIRWLRAHSGEYGIDKDKFLVWGASAGGHLAALAGTSCGAKELEPVDLPDELATESDCVEATIGWYGIYDLYTANNLLSSVHIIPGLAHSYIGESAEQTRVASIQALEFMGGVFK